MREAARQIRAIADIGDEADEASIGLLVALAWPDRIGQRRGGRGRFRMMGGGGAALPEHDGLAGEEFLAIATTDGKAGDQRIFLAAKLSKAEIVEHFASHIETRDVITWDSRARMVIANRQERFGALAPRGQAIADARSRKRSRRRCSSAFARWDLTALPWSEGDQRLRGARGVPAPAFSGRGLARSFG